MATTCVTIYSTRFCGYCRAAEDLLRRSGVPFLSIDVTGDAEAREQLLERTNGYRTVPVIFNGDTFIGGFQELARLASQGDLRGRLCDSQAA